MATENLDLLIREVVQTAFRASVAANPGVCQQLYEHGVTAREMATSFARSCPPHLNGWAIADRACELAAAGEFDDFLNDLLSKSQN